MSIDASNEKLGVAAAKAVAKALQDSASPSLTQIDLSNNALCGVTLDTVGLPKGTYNAEGIKAIAGAIGVSRSLTQINLSGNMLKVEGGTAIAEAIAVSPSLRLTSPAISSARSTCSMERGVIRWEHTTRRGSKQ